ncbi:PBP1A family penicillin-binding protein [Roseburia hominis]
MNYGKRKASKKQKEITSKSNMRKKKIGVRLFKGFLLCIVALCLLGVAGGGIFVKRIIDNAPEITPESIKPQGYTSTVYANDNVTETEHFKAAGSNRVYKTIDEIPVDLQHAFVAIEDSRFYTHNGIDPQGILRAFTVGLVNVIKGGEFTEGASTITQQLIKNNVFPDFVNEETFMDKLERKFQEQYLALQIEKQLSKDDILESYMNTINLGQNTLGVQAASKRYFNKDVSELTLSECATIAGITKNPGRYNPITNPEDSAKRRKKVLDDMLEQGFIEQDAYDEAMADDVFTRIANVNTELQDDVTVYSYFNDALAEQLMDDMTSEDGLGFSETQAYNYIYSGGLSIYSTQDLRMQAICDEELNNDNNYPSKVEWGIDYALTVTRADGTQENYSSGHVKIFGREKYNDDQGLLFSSKEAAQNRIEAFKQSIAKEGDTYYEVLNLSPQPQASVTIMDQKTGEIKAMVGGRGPKVTSRSLNRAYTGSKRQPGSCFKILAVYAPALDSAGKSLATIIRDEPYKYANGKQVRNWWGNSYRGDVTMRTAIQDSMNVCAVKMITEITPQLGFDYCQKLGLTTLVKSRDIEGYGKVTDIGQPLALGGITDGVYNYEMTAAYATIANGGVYNKPILYTKVLDHDGNVLIDNTGNSKTVLKDTTAALLTSAMQDVVKKGTGTDAALDNMPVAGKTGTTSNDVDLWFCGYTPYYTCSVWTGYDDNKHMTGEWNFHLKMWSRIMERIHEGLEYKNFTMPGSLVKKTVCTRSGKLAIAGSCPSITEWFAGDTAPTTSCSGHGEPADKDDDDDDKKDDDNKTTTDPKPTPTPTPTPTPEPTPEPTPTPDPEPTPTPDPEPTPDPAPTPDPTPSTQSTE